MIRRYEPSEDTLLRIEELARAGDEKRHQIRTRTPKSKGSGVIAPAPYATGYLWLGVKRMRGGE